MFFQNRGHETFRLPNRAQGLSGRNEFVAVVGKQTSLFNLGKYLAAG